MERLDKFLCDCGVGSRSQVKSILKAGRVRLDGAVITDGSRKVVPGEAWVTLDGQTLEQEKTLVLMLNKPAGYVTAVTDPQEKTVMELLPERYRGRQLKPVGRLDKQTEGLLLFTNDGDLAHRLISPAHHVRKVYFARHEGTATEADVEAFAKGLTLRDGTVCLPAKLEPLEPGSSVITLYQGKYHQVRRMMASRNLPVTYLERRAEGMLCLGDLPRGAVRKLSREEVLLLTSPK